MIPSSATSLVFVILVVVVIVIIIKDAFTARPAWVVFVQRLLPNVHVEVIRRPVQMSLALVLPLRGPTVKDKVGTVPAAVTPYVVIFEYVLTALLSGGRFLGTVSKWTHPHRLFVLVFHVIGPLISDHARLTKHAVHLLIPACAPQRCPNTSHINSINK
jgi:hypothetical protein